MSKLSQLPRRERAVAAKQMTADKLATIAGELEDLAVELHHAFPICSSRCEWAAEHLRNAVSDLKGSSAPARKVKVR